MTGTITRPSVEDRLCIICHSMTKKDDGRMIESSSFPRSDSQGFVHFTIELYRAVCKQCIDRFDDWTEEELLKTKGFIEK